MDVRTRPTLRACAFPRSSSTRSTGPTGPSDEPLRLLRITVGVLLLFGTAVAIALALSGIAPRALQLVGLFWAIYGFIVGLTSGILEPVIDGLSHALADIGSDARRRRILGDRDAGGPG